MTTLAQFQGVDQTVQLLQNSWAAAINPVINNPANLSVILKNVHLINGTTVVNHLLGRKLQGWKIVGQDAKASIYDNQKNCQTPDKTLILISDAAVNVNLEVF